MGNVPDDATTDRRSATATQKTGGDRGETAIDSGFVLISTSVDFSRAYTGKHLGNLPDDVTSDRKAVTGNEKTGASRAYPALDSSSFLKTGVTTTATAADGLSRIGSERFASRQGGHGGTGTVYEGLTRSGLGGVPTPLGVVFGNDLYTADGSSKVYDSASGLWIGGVRPGGSGITPSAPLRLPNTSPFLLVDGDMWYNGTNFVVRKGGANVNFA